MSENLTQTPDNKSYILTSVFKDINEAQLKDLIIQMYKLSASTTTVNEFKENL